MKLRYNSDPDDCSSDSTNSDKDDDETSADSDYVWTQEELNAHVDNVLTLEEFNAHVESVLNLDEFNAEEAYEIALDLENFSLEAFKILAEYCESNGIRVDKERFVDVIIRR